MGSGTARPELGTRGVSKVEKSRGTRARAHGRAAPCPERPTPLALTMASETDKIDTKRYDRQIRLWGLDTQRGLVGARVLMLGANGLANEIIKNLVLAGVGHVCIQDTRDVTQADLDTGGLFSVHKTQLGLGMAAALAEQLKPMNPSVEVVAMRDEVEAIDVDRLQTYNFIIGTRGIGALRELATCTAALEQSGTSGDNAEPDPKRQRGSGESGPAVAQSNGKHEVVPMRSSTPVLPKLFAAGTLGVDGFCFLDLGAATAILPLDKKEKCDVSGDGDNPLSVEEEDGPPPAKHKTERALYPTIESAARVEWAALTPRVPALYYALQLLADAGQVAKSELLSALTQARAQRLSTAGPSREGACAKLLSDAYLSRLVSAHDVELAPVTAIVGGMIASEVIKIISGKELPINNAFFFDGDSCDGVVLHLGPSFSLPGGVIDNGKFK